MKTITSSVAFQDEGGNVLANGSLIFTLPQGVYKVVSGGGEVVVSTVIVNLDATGKVPAGKQIWASDELSPQTPYTVTICGAANGVQVITSALWLVSGTSPIDLSQMTPVSGNQPSYSTPVLQNPAAQQTINGQTLDLEGASLAFSPAGSTVGDSFFSRLAAGVIGVGTAIGNALGTLQAAILQIGGSTTGLSSPAAGTVAVGNGTQGDASGTLKAVSFQALNTSDGLDVRSGGAAVDTKITIGRVGADSTIAIPGIAGHFATNADEVAGDTVIRNENSTGRVYIGALPLSGILPVSVDSAGLNIYGATSGSTKITAPAVASGSNSLQAVNDTFVYRATTDTLQNKSIKGLGAAGNNTLTLTPGQQIFTASGTFTIPTGVTAVKATLVGGGGAGGGATAVNNGGGGGSGGSAIKWLTGLTPGNTIAVTVGAGGAGVSGATGNNGTASSISSGTQVITTVTANGGTGGPSTGAISAGGPGATVSTNGDINNGGGGGGYSNGGTGGGHGGASMYGGGSSGAFSGAGLNATVIGAGGSGAGGGVNAGGSGGGGIAIFEWTN